MGKEEVDLVTVVKPDEKRSLLQKYDIPIEHLSYEYVTGCSNVKELERIVLILRSGEEGIFPDLINRAEECLAKISPKSRVLRVEEPVVTRAMLDPEDRRLIDDDMARWMSEMQGREKDLDEGKAFTATPLVPQPEIRQTPETRSAKRNSQSGAKRGKPKTIASCDYAGWDRFDADAEIDRIDLQDERMQVEAKNAQQRQREKHEEAKKFSKESIVNKLSLTATELGVLAEHEKNMGNEAYRVGDYEEALIRYNSSITINPSVNAYNNRAITNIKLRRYQEAVNDCNIVSSMEYNNVTALMRRALALEHLEKNSQALIDYQTILQLEPNNKLAIAAVNRLKKPSDSKKVRMKIEEEIIPAVIFETKVAKNEELNNVTKERSTVKNAYDLPEEKKDSSPSSNGVQSEICFCDRAPGFSQSPKPPPHYKSSYCLPPPRRTPGSRPLAVRSAWENRKADTSGTKTGCPDAESPKLMIEELPGHNEYESTYSRPPAIAELTKSKGNGEKTVTKNGDEKGKKLQTHKNRDKLADKKPEECQKPREKILSPVSMTQKKVEVASKYEKPVFKEQEVVIKDLDSIESPYEFLRVWQSLKTDVDLSLHAKLLRSLAPEEFNVVVGNKLDGGMFTILLRCLERHFCKDREDVLLVYRYLKALAKLSRFSIVRSFMDSVDKKGTLTKNQKIFIDKLVKLGIQHRCTIWSNIKITFC
ncbi:sperm-associated antigen 1 isoform X3 [Neodiprion pinetum]|uniref:sperm-associated antigen 1 isoform X3 n=1 Tax=Neodiprion pinetum TaxID=441929 RepID=UPI001EE0DA65|nr:sperm-associated antigen 1 isoform X1 [Neodiprion pinetum]